MITYKIEFEELASGSMRIHLESPPVASTTLKEQMLAKAWSDHNKAILDKLRQQPGSRWEIQN